MSNTAEDSLVKLLIGLHYTSYRKEYIESNIKVSYDLFLKNIVFIEKDISSPTGSKNARYLVKWLIKDHSGFYIESLPHSKYLGDILNSDESMVVSNYYLHISEYDDTFALIKQYHKIDRSNGDFPVLFRSIFTMHNISIYEDGSVKENLNQSVWYYDNLKTKPSCDCNVMLGREGVFKLEDGEQYFITSNPFVSKYEFLNVGYIFIHYIKTNTHRKISPENEHHNKFFGYNIMKTKDDTVLVSSDDEDGRSYSGMTYNHCKIAHMF